MGKKRISLLAVLICVFALVFSLGIMSACGDSSASTENEPAANAHWHYGTTAPADNLGNVGDYYLDTESLRAYVLTSNGEWLPTALYSGAGVPDSADGAKGDLYLDTKGGVLYQKGESLWQVVLKVEKGENGRDGVLWFSGAGNPADAAEETLTDAQTGDFYLNTTEFTVWQLGADGKTWIPLGTIKGDPGEDAVHFFDGKGTPYGKEGDFEGLKDGDLYLGTFDGFDGSGAGSRLYKYDAAKKEWNVLMDTVQVGEINIYTLAELRSFAEQLEIHNGYAGQIVHLKSDIDFTEAMSLHRAAPRATEWTPIGTSKVPFKGTFDGEGHTIYNFNASAAEGEKVGFFGYVEDATIEHLRFVGAEVTASGSGAYGAVVVGEVQKATTINDVVVENSSVEATDDNAKVGGLVGKADGAVTAKDVDVSAGNLQENEKNSLVGEGEITLEGNNAVGKELASGFVEKHHLGATGEVESTTYEILTAEGLAAFRDSVNGTGEFEQADTYQNKTVTLGNDIDFEGFDEDGNVVEANVWKGAIGEGKFTGDVGGGHAAWTGKYFSGTFDGQNHTIKNIVMVSDSSDPESRPTLFGGLGGATVKNLNFKNVEAGTQSESGDSEFGILAQWMTNMVGLPVSTVENVHVDGFTISGKAYIGGLIGYAITGSIKNCSVKNGTINGRENTSLAAPIGGMVGRGGASFETCTVENVTLNVCGSLAGGVVGHWSKSINNLEREESKSMTNISVRNTHINVTARAVVEGQEGYLATDIGLVVGYMYRVETAGKGPDKFETVTVENCSIAATSEDPAVGCTLWNAAGVVGAVGGSHAVKTGNGKQINDISISFKDVSVKDLTVSSGGDIRVSGGILGGRGVYRDGGSPDSVAADGSAVLGQANVFGNITLTFEGCSVEGLTMTAGTQKEGSGIADSGYYVGSFDNTMGKDPYYGTDRTYTNGTITFTFTGTNTYKDVSALNYCGMAAESYTNSGAEPTEKE